MKLVAQRKDLVRLLGQLTLVAKSKATAPIFTCCLLETTQTGIKGSATDLFQSVTSSALAEVKAAGGVAVSARDLLDRVKTLPEGLVQLEVVTTAKEGHKTIKLVVSAGKRKHQLPCIAADEFPPLATGPVQGFQIGGSTLAALLRRTKPMIASDPTRAAMHAACFEFTAGNVSVSATDGHRVSYVVESVTDALPWPVKLVPLEAVDALLGLVDDETPVTVGIVGAELGFAIGADLVFVTKVVEANFPPVRTYFKDAPAHELRIGREALQDALHSVEKAADGAGLPVWLDAAPGLLKLRADGKGAAEDEVEAAYDGAEVTIKINARYLLEALEVVHTEDVLLNLPADRTVDPVWVRPTDEREVLEIVMPLNPGVV